MAWRKLIAKYADRPLSVVVSRPPDPKNASKAGAASERVTTVLPPNHFVDFGFRLQIEPINSIRHGSPAEAAGFREGDTILKVDGADFDPMRLSSICYARAGQPTTFEVSRPEPGGVPKTLTLTATPDDTPPWTELVFPNEPVDVAGLGLAYPMRTKIELVTPGSPADKAGLKAGDIISALIPPEPPGGSKKSVGLLTRIKRWLGYTESNAIPLSGDEALGWPFVFQVVQFTPPGPVSLTINNSNKPVVLTPEPDPTWFNPARGEQFEYLSKQFGPYSAGPALRRGFDDTVDNILSIYSVVRSLASGRSSTKNVGGPIMIAQVAYVAASSGFTDLIHFLGILSINLAVLNFLPIPPLDGGQMVFLVAEKVRGRPLPESALAAGTYLGLFLVLSLMAFVIYQDVYRNL
jgi:regulator of sigma E protease